MNRRRRLRTMGACVGLVLFTATLSGCSIHGKWSVAHLDPDAARRDFALSSLTLQRDGTFYAESDGGAGIKTTSGTYIYDDGLLTLNQHDGAQQTYDAKLEGSTLKLTRHWKGGRVTARLEREE